MNQATHKTIRKAIRERIVAGEWQLGELIPGEVEFAEHYGCSRTTVNRAIQALADEGIVERKRKGGTRVRPLPAPQAQLTVPIVREMVESLGHAYASQVVCNERKAPPPQVRERMGLKGPVSCAYVETLHLAADEPFAFERRWVNLETVPDFLGADLTILSANEWLVRTVPFSRGEVSLVATNADPQVARMMKTEPNAALLTMERTTWFENLSVTTTTLFYRNEYHLTFEI